MIVDDFDAIYDRLAELFKPQLIDPAVCLHSVFYTLTNRCVGCGLHRYHLPGVQKPLTETEP